MWTKFFRFLEALSDRQQEPPWTWQLSSLSASGFWFLNIHYYYYYYCNYYSNKIRAVLSQTPVLVSPSEFPYINPSIHCKIRKLLITYWSNKWGPESTLIHQDDSNTYCSIYKWESSFQCTREDNHESYCPCIILGPFMYLTHQYSNQPIQNLPLNPLVSLLDQSLHLHSDTLTDTWLRWKVTDLLHYHS